MVDEAEIETRCVGGDELPEVSLGHIELINRCNLSGLRYQTPPNTGSNVRDDDMQSRSPAISEPGRTHNWWHERFGCME